MSTEFGEKLKNAVNSIESLMWRDKDGNNVKLMEASEENLQRWYRHCYEMLYNPGPKHPGKYYIKEYISRAWDSCNVVLFVRYLLHECNTDIKTTKDILEFINVQKQVQGKNIMDDSISVLFTGLSPVFEKITVKYLMNACLDKLDIFNKKIITSKFILSQGIWLTEEEKIELSENGIDGQPKNRLDVIKERLCLDPETPLQLLPTGLTYTEFRSLIQLSPLSKISLLSTTALKTLRDKILLLLENNIEYHIDKWTLLMNNIQRVAEARNIVLPDFLSEKI